MNVRIPLILLALSLSSPAWAGADNVVAKNYAKMLTCPRKSVTVTPMPGTTARTGNVTHQDYTVTACGQTFIVNGGTFMGYLYAYDDQSVRKRAPIEMQCDAVEVLHIDPTTRVVRGCSQQWTYTFVGDVFLKGAWHPATQASAR